MPIDETNDVRRLRIGLLISTIGLVTTLVLAAAASMNPEWSAEQARFKELGLTDPGRRLGIIQMTTCTGALDRCTTCHLGVGRKDLSGKQVEAPFGAHPEHMAHHIDMRVGCSICHGGTGRALDSRTAHAEPGLQTPDPLRGQPYIQASCARCHVPGDQPGMERLVRGAELYQGLGCAICHPLTRGGRGGWDFGPDLRSMGRKSIDYLRASLIDPTANFPQSTMPSFEISFRNQASSMEDVLIFLLSLVLERAGPICSQRQQSQAQVEAPCAGCHAGAAGRASGRFRHRCTYLIDRADMLKCGSCHAESVPAGGLYQGWCPAISEHRAGCSTCHDMQAKRGDE